MLKVIINSYACCPNMGSEPGMGWNWIIHLAKYCELYVITEGEFQPQIDAWFQEHGYEKISNSNHSYYMPDGSPSHSGEGRGEGLHFYWNPVTPEIRKMCWNQGDWRFYKYYEQWQRKAADIARNICRTEKIDVLHQLNMIGFREPGYLWQVSKETGIPFIWGPVGGMKQFPMAYADGGGVKMKIFTLLKNTINIWQIKHHVRVKSALNQASALISSIPDSYKAIKKYHGLESFVIPETGCETHCPKDDKCRFEQELFDVMWVGKFDFRKRLDIALMSIAVVCNTSDFRIRLRVFGTGSIDQVTTAKKMVKLLGIEDHIEFMGSCSNDYITQCMRESSIFFFTSVNEDTSTVVMEAVANGLPVLCFDACGMAAVIDDTVGIKIPLSNPNQSVADFAEQIKSLYENREELRRMSENCATKAERLSWDNKAKQMMEVYTHALENTK